MFLLALVALLAFNNTCWFFFHLHTICWNIGIFGLGMLTFSNPRYIMVQICDPCNKKKIRIQRTKRMMWFKNSGSWRQGQERTHPEVHWHVKPCEAWQRNWVFITGSDGPDWRYRWSKKTQGQRLGHPGARAKKNQTVQGHQKWDSILGQGGWAREGRRTRGHESSGENAEPPRDALDHVQSTSCS